jgi:biopolymer transport protein ExbB
MEEELVTFLAYMEAGGAIMWVILALSVIAAALVIERVIFFASSKEAAGVLEDEFSRAARGSGEPMTGGRGPARKLFSAALDNWDQGRETLRDMLEGRARLELSKWERNLRFLEITAKVSPLLGLLGTVLGMVEMFRTLNVGGSVSSAAVTGGIWKALFTTVAGLAAAIPVIIAHGALRGWIDREDEFLSRAVEFIIGVKSGFKGSRLPE